ncbi:translocation/assembly module TamB [Psychroflexus sp. CAK8W]|uniref:Translocation/assembly module TamB n=1 Tax=Psychroflexus longus TaxID=2873596 RepID=A0ABS7XJB5_9FLAO|nr:translocation/assembly module TamB domain-containing protein [Psychroflexus longus]MBZ9779067.1 translocation/assembly module TamB [Psychroflexus longus]
MSEKIDTEFTIGKLYLTFSGNLTLEDLYLEDTSQDTLVYSKYLEANVPFRPLLFGNKIKIDLVDWRGLKANVQRKDTVEGFNYQYIIDAFATPEENTEGANAEEKQTDSPQISIGRISFLEFDLSYKDEVTGIDTQLVLGNLEVKSEEINFQNMKFHLSEVNLKNTSLVFNQNKEVPPSEDQETSKLPWILVDNLSISEVEINYNSQPQSITSETYFNDFTLSELDLNLDSQVLNLDQLVWKDSRMKLEMDSTQNTSEDPKESTEPQSFSWPEWTVYVNKLDVKNQNIEFSQNGKRPEKNTFSSEALAFNSFYFKLNNLEVSKDESLRFDLNDLRFEEKSGLYLQEFKVDARLNSEETILQNLRFKLNNSSLNANLKLNYTDLDYLINSTEKSLITLDVSSIKVDVKDAYVFSPELKKNKQIQNLALYSFKGKFKAEGDLEKLNVPEFSLGWGKNTKIEFKGSLSNLNEVQALGFDLKSFKAKSNRKDLSRFVSAEGLGVSFPEKVVLSGNFKKEGNDFSTKSKLESSFGAIELEGYLNSTTTFNYDLNADLKSIKLREIFKNENLGELSMQLSSKGNGKSIYDLTAQLSSKIDSIRLDDYVFSGLKIQGDLEDGKGDVEFDYSDDNLQFDFASALELDSISNKVDLNFNLEGVNTQALGLSSKDLRAKVFAKIQFEGNLEKFKLDAQLNDGLVVYDDRPYYLGGFDFFSKVDSTQTIAEISSKFLNANLASNSNIQGISNAIQNHFKTYSKDIIQSKISNSKVNLDLKLDFVNSPILSDVFVDGIRQMDTLKAFVQFEGEKNKLASSLKLPYLNYQDNEILGLALDLESNGNSANFSFGFENISAGPLDVAETLLQGKFENDLLSLNLDASKDEKGFFSSLITVKFEENGLYRVSVSPDQLILNASEWSIPDNNEIVYQNERIDVTNFKLNRNSQTIELTDKLDFEKRHLGIVIDNFKLSNFTSYFNPDEKLAGGKLSGNLVLIEPFVSNGLVSNLNIEDLRVTEVPLGNLSLIAEAKSDEDYDLKFSLKDAGIDLDVRGNYHASSTETSIDFTIGLNKLEMETIESFAQDFIKKTNGYLKGNFEINGPLDDLGYKGDLTFNDVQFNLKLLNTLYNLKDERIEFSKDKISLNEFSVVDDDGNQLSVNGSISTQELTNPKFNLAFDAKDFQLLNTTAENNDLYFGKLVFDASAKLKGDLDFPKVNLDLSIKNATNLTYIIPESQASIKERDGVVVFVNKQNPDDILTQKDEEDFEAILTGIDLNSNITIQDKSRVKVILNKRTNDNVSIQGGGDFKFSISRTGKMNLAGKYEVSNGSVELNLYNIVKRKFDIAPTSSVTWSGDPYNAELDLRAIYKVETSASSLMASQTAGENSITQNRYKQQLPFLVYLGVEGQLMSPELNFQLDMPEDRQGAINGSVNSKISQVNQQDDQLNKQVFSLLVLNRFYPESGSDGSQGGPATMARDNINQALSDQLNTFSDKLTGNTGISLNFDVNSYTDYQGDTSQNRTDVDVTAQKKLMDDRLVVEAGSSMNVQGEQRAGESQALVGNVSVEYLLTEDGRWKLRGFRKSEYENVIDGQVFVSGIALIFTREFNKFKVLWDKAYRESLKEEEIDTKSKSEQNKEQETETNKDE